MGAFGWLIAAIGFFAALLVSHALLLRSVLHSRLPKAWKWASLIPFVTPVAGWKAQKRRNVVTWSVLLITYVVIRLIAG